jgi:hypothetical protein
MAKSVTPESMDFPDSQFRVSAASGRCFSCALTSLGLGGGLLLLLILSGCGLRTEISGTINNTDFVIPAGEVVTAVADTTINASRKIEIDGTLYLVPGANVEFESPSVNVTGKVQNLAMHAGWWQRTRSDLNAPSAGNRDKTRSNDGSSAEIFVSRRRSRLFESAIGRRFVAEHDAPLPTLPVRLCIVRDGVGVSLRVSHGWKLVSHLATASTPKNQLES